MRLKRKIQLSSDLIELLEALEKHSVRYMIIGGHAVAFHAEPRWTKDLKPPAKPPRWKRRKGADQHENERESNRQGPAPERQSVMKITKLLWIGARTALEEASLCLTEVLYPPAGAVSLTKSDDAASDDAASWRLEAYFDGAPDMAAIVAALSGVDGLSPPAVETLPDIDWVAHALAGLGIVRAGRFVLHGVHDAGKLPNEAGDIAIRIDANQAFGTGHHPTTAGCLTLLDRLAGVAPERILDLGTGSAVLAIAAAKVWSRPVLATDIDEKSAEIARGNAALNDVGELVEVIAADGFADERIARGGPYDFIFANILAGPLIELAPAMAEHAARKARVLLAGLMADQEAGVTAAYEAAGFRRLNRLDHTTWPVLLFFKA